MLGWTQADPLYRFAPDAAWTEPRKANLYGFDASNPLRYIDPDGRDILFQGSIHQAMPVVKTFHNILNVGNPQGFVTIKSIGGSKHFFRIVIHATAPHPSPTALALSRLSGDASNSIVVHNATPSQAESSGPVTKNGSTADQDRASSDEARFNPTENGGGSFSPVETGGTGLSLGGRAVTVVGHVAVNSDTKRPEVTSSMDNSQKVPQTDETILAHETLGHGDAGCRDESCARHVENTLYRKEAKTGTRETNPAKP